MTGQDGQSSWAERIRHERRSRGWSQKRLVAELFRAAGHDITLPEVASVLRRVKDHEAGRRPKDPYPLLYCRVFELTEDTLFEAPPSVAAPNNDVTVTVTSPVLPWVWDPAPTADAVYDVTRSDLMLNRRQAVKALVITADLPLVDPAQRWLAKTPSESAAVQKGSRIGLDEIAQLEQTAAVFRTWDHTHGGVASSERCKKLDEVGAVGGS